MSEQTARPGSDPDGVSESQARRAAHHEIAKEMLAAGSSYAAVAEELHVTTRTIDRWMAVAAFRRDVSERRSRRVDEVTGLLAVSALDVVGQVRQEVFEATLSGDRIRAAGLYMKWLIELRHQEELEARLCEVERRLGIGTTFDDDDHEPVGSNDVDDERGGR